ncbi:hypothetical protein COOONC_26452 [Cooperia oncophora]
MRPPYGINNYVNICNGFANFYSCLGPQNIRYCLGLIGLVGMGKSPQDAYSYEGFLADWRFKCGAGFFGECVLIRIWEWLRLQRNALHAAEATSQGTISSSSFVAIVLGGQ